MQDNDIAIRVSSVSKEFKLPHEKNTSIKSAVINFYRRKSGYELQRALNKVSLEVKKGEFLGIVGRNGSGKSTLLKLLAGIYVPTEGTIEVNGKLTPFIELGVGFNPELTGRENIYLNGSLLGFNRKEMKAMYNDIVEFAELEKFMDQKLKNYSSGMQVRLAFSIAIRAKSDILLIDEVLAVGDTNFQQKCYKTFETFKQEGRTIIFVSHSMEMVKKFCDRAILINKGTVKQEGSPEVIATEYEMLNLPNGGQRSKDLKIQSPREAHIIEQVIESFTPEDKLIEVGAAEGRHVDLIRSMGYDIKGVDLGSKKPSLPTTQDTPVTGLLVLDVRKGVTAANLSQIFKELSGGQLAQVRKVYIHLPFHLYHEHINKRSPGRLPHLDKPLDIGDLSDELSRHGFYMVEGETYGADEPYQYTEGVFERFDNSTEEKLWGSLTSGQKN